MSTSGMIMPETNFLNIPRNKKMISINSLSSSNNSGKNYQNIEEELPRQMIQPQKIISKPE